MAAPVLVFSNKPGCGAIEKARQFGIATEVLDHKDFPNRNAFDRAVVGSLQAYSPDLIVLAGYMRIVTPEFLDAFPKRVINIHPAILPAFPGVDGVRQAWEYGVKVIGCTVHFVDAQVDHGPIIVQKAISVDANESAEDWVRRLLVVEHEALIEAVNLVAQGRTSIDGRRVKVLS